jgi:hypothetical protein
MFKCVVGQAMSLQDEFKFYIENQDAFVKQYRGRFIVIKDLKVIGVYDDKLIAVRETSKTHELGTFLVQKCEPGSDNYTQTFHSRVIFA